MQLRRRRRRERRVGNGSAGIVVIAGCGDGGGGGGGGTCSSPSMKRRSLSSSSSSTASIRISACPLLHRIAKNLSVAISQKEVAYGETCTCSERVGGGRSVGVVAPRSRLVSAVSAVLLSSMLVPIGGACSLGGTRNLHTTVSTSLCRDSYEIS